MGIATIEGPRVEGSVPVRDGRRLGFAEFGSPHGAAIVWLHGTPGARRQIPVAARRFAAEHELRIIGIDRPGIGSSTPHVYDSLVDATVDLTEVIDRLGVEELATIGLSGGGPYALALAHTLGERVRAVGVLGGVAPATGPEAAEGGLVGFGARMRPLVSAVRVPLGMGLSVAIRAAHPAAVPAIGLYARLSPEGDRRLLEQPEFKAMFLDDLLRGSRKQLTAPLSDLMLFTGDWGFSLADVTQPVHWWHGDADHIVPHAHGEHVVSLLPSASLVTLSGAAHLGGLGVATDVLETLQTYLR